MGHPDDCGNWECQCGIVHAYADDCEECGEEMEEETVNLCEECDEELMSVREEMTGRCDLCAGGRQ